jgi:hypothetical protein
MQFHLDECYLNYQASPLYWCYTCYWLQTTDVFSIGFFDELLDQYIGIYTFKGIDYTSQLFFGFGQNNSFNLGYLLK